ncbi:MAG: response regulator [Deltaproteobacteria bacterium]|nr:response regulator [Deltaproteobacteria bacterium]
MALETWLAMAEGGAGPAAELGWLASLVPSQVGSVLGRATLVQLAGGAALKLEVDGSAVEPSHRLRMAFWAAQAGLAWWELALADAAGREALLARLAAPVANWTGTASDLMSQARGLMRQCGVPEDVAEDVLGRGALVRLGPDWPPAPVVSRAAPNGIFLECRHAPAVGDELLLRFPPGCPAALQRMPVRVVFVRRGKGGPDRIPGFGVAPLGQDAAVAEALACWGVSAAEPSGRAHPRYATVARVRYQSEEQFSDDYISNLSFGGAFVESKDPLPVDTELPVVLQLPSGAELSVRSHVVFQRANGMGVQFKLDQETERVLAQELARISCRPRRVLVVDDNAPWRAILGKQLRREGVEVVEAGDGQQALQALAEELMHIDLVITDLNMPVMSGRELVERIRHAGGETELPIVVISSTTDTDSRDALMRAGADLVMDKLVPLDELVKRSLEAATAKRQRLALGGGTGLSAPAAW